MIDRTCVCSVLVLLFFLFFFFFPPCAKRHNFIRLQESLPSRKTSSPSPFFLALLFPFSLRRVGGGGGYIPAHYHYEGNERQVLLLTYVCTHEDTQVHSAMHARTQRHLPPVVRSMHGRRQMFHRPRMFPGGAVRDAARTAAPARLLLLSCRFYIHLTMPLVRWAG